jgi:hypothetical protein
MIKKYFTTIKACMAGEREREGERKMQKPEGRNSKNGQCDGAIETVWFLATSKQQRDGFFHNSSSLEEDAGSLCLELELYM